MALIFLMNRKSEDSVRGSPDLELIRFRGTLAGLVVLAVASVQVGRLALEAGEEGLGEGVFVGSPAEPIDGCTPACRHRWRKATDMYWVPWS
jgi:hypothetical protein